jgi:hypothetical protein
MKIWKLIWDIVSFWIKLIKYTSWSGRSKVPILIRSLLILLISSGILLSFADLSDWLLIIEKLDPDCRVEFYRAGSFTLWGTAAAHHLHVLSIYALERVVAALIIAVIWIIFLLFWKFLSKAKRRVCLQILNEALDGVILFTIAGETIEIQFLHRPRRLFIAWALKNVFLSLLLSFLLQLVILMFETF